LTLWIASAESDEIRGVVSVAQVHHYAFDWLTGLRIADLTSKHTESSRSSQ
jgi:hypothetical protein